MYYSNKNSRFRGGGGRQSFGRGGARGGFRQKFFDATHVIEKSKSQESISTESASFVAKNSFVDFEIAENLKQNILRVGYKTPTHIQDEAVPELLKGRDLVGIARTGTGK